MQSTSQIGLVRLHGTSESLDTATIKINQRRCNQRLLGWEVVEQGSASHFREPFNLLERGIGEPVFLHAL